MVKSRMNPGRRDRQRGAVLITVMVLMAFMMLFGATFINHVLTSESDEVERLLADTRAYWAMNGHLNYMLSRAAYQGLCAGALKQTTQALNAASACDTVASDDGATTGTYPSTYPARTANTRVGALQDYLDGTNEIQVGGSINTPGRLYWYYPQNATDVGEQFSPASPKAANAAKPYQFAVRAVVDERLNSLDAAAFDGQIRVDFEVLSAADGAAVGSAPAVRDLGHRVGRLTVGLCVVDMEDNAGTATRAGVTTNCPSSLIVDGAAVIQFIQRNYPLP